jgi:uncharacterized protein YbjT (DUF2867 family)
MKILLTGANGFIGRYLMSALSRAGHQVVPAVRNPADMDSAFTDNAPIKIDLNRDTNPDVWLPRLQGIDAVINCAGILQGDRRQSIDAIHDVAPKALFKACELTGVRRVIQISAISASADAGTAYALSKTRADGFLAGTGLNWTVVKPSLVYAPGAYGGTALLRAMASLPWLLPLPGNGRQMFRPIFIDDLSAWIVAALSDVRTYRGVFLLAGPDELTLKDILLDLRRWLGFTAAATIVVPMGLIRIAARLGDIFGGTINSTALKQLEFGNSTDGAQPGEQVALTATGWRQALREQPAQLQDRWHARLYFLRPLLRVGLGVSWILSGLIGLLLPLERASALFETIGITSAFATVLFVLTCLLDIAIGLAVLRRWRPAWTTLTQLAVVVGYTLALSFGLPELWSDPFGPLVKNIIFIIAALVLAAIEWDR